MKLSLAAVAALTVIALSSLCQVSLAAGGPPPPPTAGAPGGNPNWIGLTAGQQARMKVRLQKRNADMMALQNDKTMSMQEKMMKAQILEKAYENDMNGMLTPVQKQRIAEKRKEFMNSPAGKEMAVRKARYDEIVDLQQKISASLSPAQKQQIGQLQTLNMQAAQAIQSDKSLSDAAKEAKLTSLSNDSRSKMNTILTPEQRAQFAKLQSLYPARPVGPPPPGH